jgi:hypothetical protein
MISHRKPARDAERTAQFRIAEQPATSDPALQQSRSPNVPATTPLASPPKLRVPVRLRLLGRA